jgi:uncharacterized membrane protein YdjX (TVP38/TMEM64 family)
MAALVLEIQPLRDAAGAALRGDSGAVRAEIRGLGVAGVLVVLALCLIHTVVWYPAEIVDAAAGFVYGFWGAFALVMTGWLLNGLVAYAIGHSLARPMLHRVIGEERFDRAERLVHSGGATLLLAVRLVPVLPFSLMSYAAGAARVPVGRFIWTTLVGYTPITAISVLLGTRLEDFSFTDPLVLGSLTLLLVLLVGAHLLIPRRRD